MCAGAPAAGSSSAQAYEESGDDEAGDDAGRLTGPEWDDQESGDYQDGREQGETDARAGRPPSDCDGMPPARREGYMDGFEDATVKSAAGKDCGDDAR